LISAGLSYWLYFVQWTNSAAVPVLFHEAPVRLVEWMETEDENSLFIFPIRSNVSPTTRPELFTVRYMFDGPAGTVFPEMNENTVGQTLAGVQEMRPETVKLMTHNRIAVDPKSYFPYILGVQGSRLRGDHLSNESGCDAGDIH
jgi:hypothetical protein